MNKKELYKLEKPIYTFDARVQKTGYFTIYRKVERDLNINENYVILFRLRKFPKYIFLSKICNARKFKRDLISKLPSKIILELNLKLPDYLKIEIIGIEKIGFQPEIKDKKGFLDTINYFSKCEEFTIFNRPNDFITVYYLKKVCPSIITIPRYIKIDDLSCWNFGFYLADGEKHRRDYRFSVANNKHYLIKRFRDFGEKYLDIDRSEWYLDISTNKYNRYKIDFWKNKLNLRKEKAKIIVINKNPPLSKYGNASLTIYNKVLGFLIKNIIYDMNFIKKLNYDDAFAFLRGIQAGDGGVLQFTNGLIELTITMKPGEFKISQYLLDLICSKSPRVRDHHISNKVKILYHRGNDMAREYIMDGHFREHKSRWNKLIKIYKEKDKVRRQFKYLKSLLNGCHTIREMAEYAGVTSPACNEMMKKFLKLDFVEYKIEKVNNYNFDKARMFQLTNEGMRYINLLNIKN